MKNQDYIRAGIRLADGFKLWVDQDGVETVTMPDDRSLAFSIFITFDQYKDALAAQLFRQISKTGYFVVLHNPIEKITQLLTPFAVYFNRPIEDWNEISYACGRNVTMNTLKCVVDSKVLEDSTEGEGSK